MELPFYILATVIAVVGIAAALYQNVYRWKSRRRQWEQAAMELGLRFEDEIDLSSRFSVLEFFQRGHHRRTRICLAGSGAGAPAYVADYQFTNGSGRNQSVHRQTVCVFQGGGLTLPQFLLRPERAILDRIGGLFGAQDIDFAEDPAFSKAFVLRGADEASVRELFHIERRQRLLRQLSGRFHLEGAGEFLLFHTGRLIKPSEARETLQRAGDVLDILRR